jgi:plastocyanin
MRFSETHLHRRGAAALSIFLLACGGGDGDTDRGQAGVTAAVEVENPATLTGHIAFTGAPPARQTIDMREEPACAERFDPDYPHAHAVAVRDGRMQNTFVYISEGITDRHPAPDEQVLIDQVACIYTPRVVGVQTGQTIVFRNSDGLLHNIRATPSVNRGFNVSQPTNMDTPRSFNAREVMIPVECNVHGWMDAYIGVLDHPYYAVSGEDGSFRITNIPPGTYTIETWHEQYGTQTQQVTLGPNETQELTFTYDATMAGRPVPLGPPLDPHAHAASPAADATHHAHGAGR